MSQNKHEEAKKGRLELKMNKHNESFSSDKNDVKNQSGIKGVRADKFYQNPLDHPAVVEDEDI